MPALAINDKTHLSPADLAAIKFMERIYRGRLRKLCRRRFGYSYPPDDASGRAMLTALLRFGLSADAAAMVDAPWLSSDDLKTMQRTARRMKWEDVGALIELTYEEHQACKLWVLTPYGMSAEEVKRRQSEKNIKNARERKRRQRQRQREVVQKMRNMNTREEAILRMLVTPSVTDVREGASIYRSYGLGWTPVAALVREAQHCNAFLTPRGQQQRNLRQIVHRTVNRLKRCGAIKTMLKGGHYGPVLCVAPVVKRAAFSERHSVTPGRDAKGDGKTVVYLANVTEKTLSRSL
jgi:hypothetical protein